MYAEKAISFYKYSEAKLSFTLYCSQKYGICYLIAAETHFL